MFQWQSAQSFCFNHKCEQKNNFICNDDDCECYQNHKKCPKLSIKTLLKQIKQRFTMNQFGVNEFIVQISQMFTGIIDKISQNQDIMKQGILNDLKVVQLTNLQKSFIRFLFHKKCKKFKNLMEQN